MDATESVCLAGRCLRKGPRLRRHPMDATNRLLLRTYWDFTSHFTNWLLLRTNWLLLRTNRINLLLRVLRVSMSSNRRLSTETGRIHAHESLANIIIIIIIVMILRGLSLCTHTRRVHSSSSSSLCICIPSCIPFAANSAHARRRSRLATTTTETAMASTTTANHAAANTERELRTAADATGTTYGTTNVSRNREAAEARLGLFMVTDILYRRAQGRIEAILEFVRDPANPISNLAGGISQGANGAVVELREVANFLSPARRRERREERRCLLLLRRSVAHGDRFFVF